MREEYVCIEVFFLIHVRTYPTAHLFEFESLAQVKQAPCLSSIVVKETVFMYYLFGLNLTNSRRVPVRTGTLLTMLPTAGCGRGYPEVAADVGNTAYGTEMSAFCIQPKATNLSLSFFGQ